MVTRKKVLVPQSQLTRLLSAAKSKVKVKATRDSTKAFAKRTFIGSAALMTAQQVPDVAKGTGFQPSIDKAVAGGLAYIGNKSVAKSLWEVGLWEGISAGLQKYVIPAAMTFAGSPAQTGNGSVLRKQSSVWGGNA
tara:strand:- start:877 stop:1284 length:408 start_codon:yes stop_codon:yes gene_type:complete